jgi:hypothetical protein
MKPTRRFTILTFPQYFDGDVLKLNIVFLPRNQNPLMDAIEPSSQKAPPFADAKLSFVAKIITGLAGLPTDTFSVPPVALTTAQPANARPLFEALAKTFQIDNLGASNTDANINFYPNKAPDPLPVDQSVKKYLPFTYRRAFHFVAPRTKNAVTDDSYHCAVRAAEPVPFTPSPQQISWGKVFAYAMRQPLLARELGMIYETQIALDKAWFPKGGWLYIDLADGSDYKAKQNADPDFIARYAARIPALDSKTPRNVFAAIQFPVLAAPAPGNYDRLFIEAADYDDGFGKIVHAFQAVSNNLLLEESDGFHPTKETGIRLGWDDEQILIWYMRQLAEDESVGPGQRIDAPIGVFGYRVDVRAKTTGPGNWQSLNRVASREKLVVVDPAPKKKIPLGVFKGDLNYQVYPAQLDGDKTKNYWLPMYFANWNGKSMVLPDAEAAEIYQLHDVQPDGPTNVTGPPANNLNKIYMTDPLKTPLRYGQFYQFRVRLSDLSGGGPDSGSDFKNETPSQIATCHFRRYVAPSTVRINNLPANTDENYFADNEIDIRRPLLGYPSVVFTGKYANAVDLLKQASVDMKGKEAFGIADPDVDRVEITVELQSLKMDNLMSVSGQESYIKFYTTTRKFPKASPVFDDKLVVPLEFRDCRVLNFGDPGDLGDLGVNQADIDGMDKLILPRARTIRLTVRPVCEEKSGYYGLEKPDPEFNTRYGRTVQFQIYREAQDEKILFAETGLAKKIQGIYLQPDPEYVVDGKILTLLLGKDRDKPPDMIQRLAQQLGVESKGLTLVGKQGRRVQFGCSQRIRHTLSPDNASITFASKGDLTNHWLCAITLEIERDWTWDALQDLSLRITREKRFREDKPEEAETGEIGDVEIKKTAPFNALINPQRAGTTVIFIDAVETKNVLKQPPPNETEPRFPDLIELTYTIEAQFKPQDVPGDNDLTLGLELPVAVPPVQVPKIVSAGIALSPYVRNEKYSSTQARRRYLWIEFEEPVKDPKDAYFARVLAYAPDQLISNNNPELFTAPQEPALPVDPENIRVVIPGQSNDDAGLDAMQPMEKATDSDRHYLLPMPPGLHAESPEMFGFFTYEIRVGHYRYGDTTDQHKKGESVWTTAQGRFGRPLRATGIQHSAPTLTCTTNRDEDILYVTAPYAVAVANGKNVTSDPPRTELWCLLYAQVRQADNLDFRNVLLDDRILDWRVRVEHRRKVDWKELYTDKQRATLKQIAIKNWKDQLNISDLAHHYQLADFSTVNKDATKYGTVIWKNDEVAQLLELYGLPADTSLSVLCVEILPQITSVYDHVNNLEDVGIYGKMLTMFMQQDLPSHGTVREAAAKAMAVQAVSFNEPKPLSDRLGHYRILRTSPLVEVPFVCT